MVTYISLLILLFFVTSNKAWRAVPASENMYSARRQLVLQKDVEDVGLELLPRTSIHSVYKFGWCASGADNKVFLRKSSYIHFPAWQSAQADYIYLIEPKHTIRYRLQCIVLRIMVPRMFLFRRSRLPMYYCQGYAYYVMFDFVQRLDMHEFYLHNNLNMPADLFIDFYHPQEL